MEIKQQLRLSQQLVMTPQLQQAIRLLQLSRLELIEEVRKELDNNPMLSDEEPEGRMRDPGEARVAAEQRSEDPAAYLRTNEQKVQERASREVDWEKFLENRTLQ
jgi:RNA polymerase sigma-54 factor